MRFTLKPSRRAVTVSGALILPGVLAAGLLALPAQSSTAAVGRPPTETGLDGPIGASRVSSLINAAQFDRPTPKVATQFAEPYSPSKSEELAVALSREQPPVSPPAARRRCGSGLVTPGLRGAISR